MQTRAARVTSPGGAQSAERRAQEHRPQHDPPRGSGTVGSSPRAPQHQACLPWGCESPTELKTLPRAWRFAGQAVQPHQPFPRRARRSAHGLCPFSEQVHMDLFGNHPCPARPPLGGTGGRRRDRFEREIHLLFLTYIALYIGLLTYSPGTRASQGFLFFFFFIFLKPSLGNVLWNSCLHLQAQGALWWGSMQQASPGSGPFVLHCLTKPFRGI